MRNVIVCCDGTWNTPDQRHDGVPNPTNVVRFYNALAEKGSKGNEQLRYYHPGVGSDGNWWEKLAGGGVGIGLGKNVMSGYRWLAANYTKGDRISVFGFSRGAYTARSLAGLVTSCGLLDLSGLSDSELWKRVERAYSRGYRKKEARSKWAKGWEFHGTGNSQQVKVYLVGVWDTVGALGIPNDLAILNLLDNVTRYSFHDTKINANILNARHAVAIDEQRASFAPTLWTHGPNRKTIKQVWFPGMHSDVGGGYPEIGLSDGALKWMMDEAKGLGIGFRKGMYDQVKPDCRGVLHDSYTGVFKHLRSQPRSAPLLTTASQGIVHKSALDRRTNPAIAQAPYRPTFALAKGKRRELTIYALAPWNETGIYLDAGVRYKFAATGQWVDRNIKCGPGGAADGTFHFGELAHAAGTLWGKVEGLFKKITKNAEADFIGTRREEDLPWFSLVGAVANGGGVTKEGRHSPHEMIAIGDGCEYKPKKSGYLYCFANDAWHFYGNNSGSVRLTVERLT